MRLAGRLERLEQNHGGPVRITDWLDSRGERFEPSEELRRHVEEQATLGPERAEWACAVLVGGDRPFIVVFAQTERGKTQQILDLP